MNTKKVIQILAEQNIAATLHYVSKFANQLAQMLQSNVETAFCCQIIWRSNESQKKWNTLIAC